MLDRKLKFLLPHTFSPAPRIETTFTQCPFCTEDQEQLWRVGRGQRLETGEMGRLSLPHTGEAAVWRPSLPRVTVWELWLIRLIFSFHSKIDVDPKS